MKNVKQVHENVSECIAEDKTECRERIDLLRSRMGLLKGKEKVLMAMYIENGNSFRQMARLAGVNESSIARKIYKITRRLMNGEYITCLQNRERFRGNELDIARDYLVYGLSLKKITKRRRATYYRVRKVMIKIQEIVRVGAKDEN
jgi:predicted DNA-binding protein YlxM (UPF0122 family)